MPELVSVLQRNLRRALRARDLDDAAEILRRLQREAPLDLVTRGLELELLLVARRLDEAERLGEQLVQLFPTSARVWYLAGRVAYARREYERAESLLCEAERLSPSWRLRLWIGKTLTQAGRLDEAEAILVGLREDHPRVGRDLAWLYERRGEAARATEELKRYLELVPDDAFAAEQLERLRARSLEPERLQKEVEDLLELGEEVSGELLGEHVDSLLRTGQGRRARELVLERGAALEERARLRLGWVCHQRAAPDLAYHLFAPLVSSQAANVKLLSALEADARQAGREQDLLEVYRAAAIEQPRLWGRARRLERRLRA